MPTSLRSTMSTKSPSTEIPFALPSIGPEEEAAVIEVLRSGWLTTGRVTESFEREFAAVVGARHALAVSSATAGLHLSLEAVGVRPGDLVITSPYTFTATAEVARYLGAHPLFVDIDPASLNIDPERVEEALRLRRRARFPAKARIAALIPVHFAGLPCAMAALLEAARRHGVPIVEDAAHAFPVRARGADGALHFAGTLGSAGVYSFYATKTITTGEGGMVVTEDERIARRVSLMRLHGIDRQVWDRYTSKRPGWEYQVVEAGYKYNLTDLASAVGRAQLAKARGLLERRRAIAERYLSAFAEADWLTLPLSSDEHAWHLFTLRLIPGRLTIDRDEFIRSLMEQGIGASVHFIPLHLMPYYRNLYGFKPQDYPNALRAFQNVVSIPIYPGLTDDQVERIINTVKSIGERHYRGGSDGAPRG